MGQPGDNSPDPVDISAALLLVVYNGSDFMDLSTVAER
jgi:hypothetical protein